MPRAKQDCKRCGAAAGQHEPKCRYYAKPPAPARKPEPLQAVASPKIRKRVFTIDHQDGSETTITVSGPAGAVKCNSTEQSLQVWTGDNAPAMPSVGGSHALSAPGLVARSTDVSRSGQEYTTTDRLDDFPGGMMGMTEEEASDPAVVLERTRLGMIGRMSNETGSSDVLLIPEGSN